MADTGPDVRVFVNEVHYANEGVDAGEFVELAGPAGADLTGYEVVLYDGESGAAYAGTPLTGAVGDNGVAVVDYPLEGIQDGPGGVAVVKAAEVTQFLSWGGALSAEDGPAAGTTSTDVGVLEPADSSPDVSLRRGIGDTAGDFQWTGPARLARCPEPRTGADRRTGHQAARVRCPRRRRRARRRGGEGRAPQRSGQRAADRG